MITACSSLFLIFGACNYYCLPLAVMFELLGFVDSLLEIGVGFYC